MDPTYESKQLAMQLKENEDSYVTGSLDLNEPLDEQNRLWKELQRKSGDQDRITAKEIMPDSQLMKLNAGLAKRSAKHYNPDSMNFSAEKFSKKLKLYYDHTSISLNESQFSVQSELLWSQLGNEARKLIYTVPSFNFIHGTFDPDPVEVIKKRRKMKEKDKLAAVTKPQSMSLKESSENRDMMVSNAEKVLGILAMLLKRKSEAICFYEFVVDPASFGRTIENIFIVSLLVNQNCVRILKDRNDLPCLLLVQDEEKAKRNPASTKQSILSMSKEEWKNIVKTFKFKTALIPPLRANYQRNGTE